MPDIHAEVLHVFISSSKQILGTLFRIGDNIFFLWLYSPVWALAASMKLSVSLQLLDVQVGQSAGLLGRVIDSSQGIFLYTNTEKKHTQHKH
jgi:hypothetical protein